MSHDVLTAIMAVAAVAFLFAFAGYVHGQERRAGK
jgi:hypothetical protein